MNIASGQYLSCRHSSFVLPSYLTTATSHTGKVEEDLQEENVTYTIFPSIREGGLRRLGGGMRGEGGGEREEGEG